MTVAEPVVHADFFEDLRLWLHETMTGLGWELPNMVAFRARGLGSEVQALSVAYLSGLLRRIPTAHRRVEWSTELRAKMTALADKTVLGLQTVEAESLAGEDLNARLSKLIEAPANLKKLDMLLADWGIHHLHLGQRVPGRRFTERDDPLLFVRATMDVLHFIDVLPHGSWEEDCLMRIVWRNWRQLLTPLHIRGGEPLTPEERKQARAFGAQTFWQAPDGVNYSPSGGGYSTARISSRAVSDADRLLDQVRQTEMICRAEAGEIAEQVGQAAGCKLSELHLTLRVDPEGTGNPFRQLVEETSTKVVFAVT